MKNINLMAMGYGLKRWAEFFFINENQNLCCLSVHGYSVENLMRSIQQMFYDDLSLCEVELTVKPVEKTNSQVNSKYFIADFDYKALPEEAKGTFLEITRDLQIWREETLTGDALIEMEENYRPPISSFEVVELEAAA